MISRVSHLYYSALITFVLKVVVLPWLLHGLIIRLNIRWDVETLINIPTTMLIGIALVIFSFNLALPITQWAETITRSTLGIAIACVLNNRRQSHRRDQPSESKNSPPLALKVRDGIRFHLKFPFGCNANTTWRPLHQLVLPLCILRVADGRRGSTPACGSCR